MQTTPASSAPTRCPLCGGDNRCAMEVERASGQPPDLLARLPAEAAGKACICATCLAAFTAGAAA